jgi:hypothetical protein
VLISHDYLLAKGVKAAFTEFFANKPEPVMELIDDQCMIVKLGERGPVEQLDLIQNASLGGRGTLSHEAH